MLGVDSTIEDDRSYYGEAAIHFKSDGIPLLLPITIAVHHSLYDSLQQDEPFIKVESLDNRLVFVRREAISDLYFSSDAYDDYGPESDRYEEFPGIFPDDDFWAVAEVIDILDEVEDEFDPEVLADAKSKLLLTEEELDRLIADGHVKPEDRNRVELEVAERREQLIAHARDVTWQMGRCRRKEAGIDAKDLYERFSWLAEDPAALEQPIILSPEGYHRTIFIQPAALDYIWIPAHKFHEGELEEAKREEQP